MGSREFKTSKSSLFLMELILAILFFSLAAAICVQMFVKSHQLSRDSVKLNHAVVYCESMAETFYSTDGDLNAMAKILEGSLNENTITVSNDEYCVEGKLTEDGKMLTLDISCYYENIGDDNYIYGISPKLFPQISD